MKVSQRMLSTTALLVVGFILLALPAWAAPSAGGQRTLSNPAAPQTMCRTESPKVIAAAGGPISLNKGLVRVPLALPTAGDGSTRLAERIEALEPERRVYLVVRGVRAAAQPGVLFHLYLNVPEGVRPKSGNVDQRYVGTINFYDAVVRGDAAAQASGRARSVSFDVTALLGRLRAQNLLGQQLSVTVVPAGPPAEEASPQVGCIELVLH